MLWLIWIALMLAVPLCAGMGIWFQLNREANDAPVVQLNPDESIPA